MVVDIRENPARLAGAPKDNRSREIAREFCLGKRRIKAATTW